MTLLWLLPLLVTAAGTLAVAVVGARVAEEAGELRRELARLGQLRPALVEVGAAGRALRASLARMERR